MKVISRFFLVFIGLLLFSVLVRVSCDWYIDREIIKISDRRLRRHESFALAKRFHLLKTKPNKTLAEIDEMKEIDRRIGKIDRKYNHAVYRKMWKNSEIEP